VFGEEVFDDFEFDDDVFKNDEVGDEAFFEGHPFVVHLEGDLGGEGDCLGGEFVFEGFLVDIF
jgi:hypothetical protein